MAVRAASDKRIIKLRSGITMEFRGNDIPSIPTLLILFNRLRAKAEGLSALRAKIAALKERLA